MRALVVIVALAACSEKLPSRPDEAKFRALTDDDKCRATASRAIMCTDELIVAQLRAIPGVEGDMATAVEEDMTSTSRSPREDRKQNIAVHKTNCVADKGYADAVFTCWSIDDCKKFASCIVESTAPRPPTDSPN